MSVLSDIANGVKKLQEVNKELSEVDFREAILDQKKLLLDAKESLLENADKIRALEDEVARLKSNLNTKHNLIEREGYSYRKNSKGEPMGLPMCTVCIDRDGRQIMITPTKGMYEFGCPDPKCGATFKNVIFYPWEKD